jgi:mRNA interferase RelE/StbE
LAYRLQILPIASSELEATPKKVRERITSKIRALRDNPRPSGVKYLQGKLKGYCRIRSGDYRIIYAVLDAQQLVIVSVIGNRRDVYD